MLDTLDHSSSAPFSEELEPLYDTHAHFYTSDVATYRVDPTGAREGVEALVQRIIADPGTPERVFALWDANNVAAGAAVQYNTAYKTDNSYLLRITEEHPERLGAVIILNASDPKAPQHLSRLSQNRGVTGLRLVGFANEAGKYDFLSSGAAMATWAQAEYLGIAIVLMIRLSPGESPAPTLATVGELAGRFPAAQIVLDHFCWPGIDTGGDAVGLTPAHRALAVCTNVSFKITSLNFMRFDREGIASDRFVREAADIFGASRLMWGSDFGNTLTDYGMLAAQARRSAALLDETERGAYYRDTGSAIFAPRRS